MKTFREELKIAFSEKKNKKDIYMKMILIIFFSIYCFVSIFFITNMIENNIAEHIKDFVGFFFSLIFIIIGIYWYLYYNNKLITKITGIIFSLIGVLYFIICSLILKKTIGLIPTSIVFLVISMLFFLSMCFMVKEKWKQNSKSFFSKWGKEFSIINFILFILIASIVYFEKIYEKDFITNFYFLGFFGFFILIIFSLIIYSLINSRNVKVFNKNIFRKEIFLTNILCSIFIGSIAGLISSLIKKGFPLTDNYFVLSIAGCQIFTGLIFITLIFLKKQEMKIDFIKGYLASIHNLIQISFVFIVKELTIFILDDGYITGDHASSSYLLSLLISSIIIAIIEFILIYKSISLRKIISMFERFFFVSLILTNLIISGLYISKNDLFLELSDFGADEGLLSLPLIIISIQVIIYTSIIISININKKKEVFDEIKKTN
ncbi:MAG: hypothetical protein K4H23_05040 [Mollicutes bacterium PWAP]|nr:hypothetical protein [Mollicutes bacterium PWAP]